MRPKKKILLIDANEDRRATQQFTFRTWGYRVVAVGSLNDAVAALANLYFEVAVIGWPMTDANLLDVLHLREPHTRTLVLAETIERLPADIIADCSMCGKFAHSDLRDRLKIMAASKRGPRKPVQRASIDLPEATRRTA